MTKSLPSSSEHSSPGESPIVERRDFLRGIGVTLAGASALLSACTRAPSEKIVPYRVQPADVKVGEASFYATAMSTDGYATGLLVESHEGRPTKVEGNPDHPASLGACGAVEQAALLELYAMSRQREILQHGKAAAPVALEGLMRTLADPSKRGAGVHLVMRPTSSPLVLADLTLLRSRLPELSIHFHTPLSRSSVWHGTERAFGRVLEPRFDARRASVMVSLDADFLAHGPARLALARGFAEGRRVLSRADEMNRLYVVEAALSVTGQVADHRFALRDSEMPRFVAELLVAVGALLRVSNAALDSLRAAVERQRVPNARRESFVRAVARDLAARRSAAFVMAGERQPAVVHAATHALNTLLGGSGSVVTYAPSPIVAAGSVEHESLGALRSALAADAVEALFLFDVDLAESTPGGLGLASQLARAKTSVFFGALPNATARACEWTAPLAHWLESWGDTRAFDGTVSLVQPLIEPLFGARDINAVLAQLIGLPPASTYDRLRELWRSRLGADFERGFDQSLQRGIIEQSAIAAVPAPELAWDWVPELAKLAAEPAPALELSVYPDNRTLDGRHAQNPWLLEFPDPVTKLAWQNAALLAPATAARLGLQSGDVVTLSSGKAARKAVVLSVPGQAENTVALSLGWGQKSGLATTGTDAFALVSETQPWTAALEVTPSGRREELAMTQQHMSAAELTAGIFVSSTLEHYRKHPDFTKELRKRQLSLYSADTPQAAQQWAMAIDLNACVGCGACVVACQAENNIPSVGRDGVLTRREMHWLRIDRYVLPDESIALQPMACQHCEQAPCEYVCPTAATVHSSDGLNQMVYNRCVGTRFCSNNCPYKVRRFNWFNYNADDRAPHVLAKNPEVTVRARGVMEKCTYCVQRIRKAQIKAEISGAAIADGSLRTACEQTCPTNAIVFGNVADRSSRVAQLHQNERAFEVLNELGTRPRTRYLAKLRNPNPEVT